MHPPLEMAKIGCQLTAEARRMGVPFASVIGQGPQSLSSYLTPSNLLCMPQPLKNPALVLLPYFTKQCSVIVIIRCGPQRASRISEPSLPTTWLNNAQLPVTTTIRLLPSSD